MAESIIFQATENTETITFEATESGESITVYLNEQARGPVGTGGGGGASSWDDLTSTANDIPFDTTPTNVPTGAGIASWNADDNTLDIQTGLGGVTLQVGQEQHIKARNNSGATISNGAVVYLSGASGQRPTIALADADNDTHVASTIGLATAEIANNSFGMVTTSGLVRGVNTAGMTEGGPIYLSGTAGAFTQTAPTSNIVRVGWCIVAGNNGTVLVHVEKMSVKSADVLDASSSGAADRLLKYDSEGGLFAQYLGTNGPIKGYDAGGVTEYPWTIEADGVLSEERFYTLPNLSGTFAMVSQIPDTSGLQVELVSGGNIRTVAGQTLLDNGDVPALLTDPTGITGADALTNIVSLTQAEYNDIGSKSATTLYIIT
jgi:hypothetical protein